ncbi:molybdopterin molybdenumtransferase [Glutamicibacter uratoxydans]|uniref:Molybdopterin molybdenumtransferase n=1 Tax=Glutamicibacter uratoxydans TaxID=43667 RepID=A0A4Y4DLP1_GLUUR|nr:gephyrin-like molybdotransferase Glp [Glutamicibacter uratoxydans]GED06249.1 molybdopterin molybdenumtransferase [Glutamicibacter uratoxydans]
MACTLENHRREVSGLLAEKFASLPAQVLPVASAQLLGRITAADLSAALPIPAFTNSQMDGYAARSADLAQASEQHPVSLPLGLTAAAGDPQITLEPGTVSPVMTGAMIPLGADTVIPVEHSVEGAFGTLVRAGEGTPSGKATFTAPGPVGRFIRPAGQDLAAGALVAAAGTRLTPTMIGAMAASGITDVPVVSQPRVLVCTTGNELGDSERSGLGAGQIPDANSPMLAAVLRGYGALVDTERFPDDVSALHDALLKTAADFDLIITVGGISAGAYEVVKDTLAPMGADFHSVAMQPGGPQGLGSIGSTPVLCFPGNPVSSFLSLELFLAPVLRAVAGMPEPLPERAELAQSVASPANKHQVRRAMLQDGKIHVLDPGSHMVHDLARADALVHIPVGTEELAAGSMIEFWRMHV